LRPRLLLLLLLLLLLMRPLLLYVRPLLLGWELGWMHEGWASRAWQR
jgi:hypothetical protein